LPESTHADVHRALIQSDECFRPRGLNREDCPTHAQRRGRRRDQVRVLGGVASAETKCAFDQVHGNSARRTLASIDKAIQLDRRRRTDRQYRLVAQHEFCDALGLRLDPLVPVQVIAPQDGDYLSCGEIALDLADDDFCPPMLSAAQANVAPPKNAAVSSTQPKTI
jgi:hypothetical protein